MFGCCGHVTKNFICIRKLRGPSSSRTRDFGDHPLKQPLTDQDDHTHVTSQVASNSVFLFGILLENWWLYAQDWKRFLSKSNGKITPISHPSSSCSKAWLCFTRIIILSPCIFKSSFFLNPCLISWTRGTPSLHRDTMFQSISGTCSARTAPIYDMFGRSALILKKGRNTAICLESRAWHAEHTSRYHATENMVEVWNIRNEGAVVPIIGQNIFGILFWNFDKSPGGFWQGCHLSFKLAPCRVDGQVTVPYKLMCRAVKMTP